MNLQDCYLEEDLFPMIFTEYEERDYGINKRLHER